MKKILQIALGIIAAIGGYLDIGDLVFNTEAGAIFGYQLLPVVRAGNDRELMGEHANGIVTRSLGWLYFGIVCVLAVAAPILLVATNGGGG